MYTCVHSMSELTNVIGKNFVDDIRLRFPGYVNLAKTFLVESDYIDREWREEFSTFYSFTFYKDISPFTTRIHFLERDIKGIENIEDVQPKEYLGFIVLRPAPVPGRILKAFLAPRKDALGVEPSAELYMALCRFEPHIGGKEFSFYAFPFYSQDSVVTVCAHASMFMNGLFMHRKHGMNRPFFRDFAKFTTAYPGRVIPSQGLTPIQMATILASLGYNPVLEAFETNKNDELSECLNKIDSYLESALPPLLIYGPHVLSIVGHTLKDEARDYIVFDDSGYHLKKLAGAAYFGYKVKKEILTEALKKAEICFIISFEFERQYFPLKSVEGLLKLTLSGEKRRRILIVDSKDFKIHAKLNNVMAFENASLPHYLWIVEFYSSAKLFCEIIIDASAHKDDNRNSVLAIWFADVVKLYKPSSRVIKVDRYPISFSNLLKVDN